MSKITYAASIDSGPAYTTDDRGRLWAYVQGVLVGSGVESTQAVASASSLVNAVIDSQKERDLRVRGGRSLRVWVWAAEEASA